MLVEQPGPWGSEAVVQSRLPTEIAHALRDRAQAHGVRVLLLRGPDRPSEVPSDRQCFVAHSGRDAERIEHRTVADAAELLAIDFAALKHGRPAGFGALWGKPLYLVCTNGRHDPCCAQLGRPVAQELFATRADMVWECSHFGGDRFAGNLVCLPHGFYFGRLGPAEAAEVVATYERGLIALDHYRGRAGDPFVVQAAEFFVRRAEGLLGVDDLAPTGFRRISLGVIDVGFDALEGRRFRVRVGLGPSAHRRPLTCAAVQEQSPTEYSLLDLHTE